MSRVNLSPSSRQRRKSILKMTSGYRGRAKNCYRIANRKFEKALQYQYRDRKNKKREFKSLWITRINAFARQNGLKYSSLMNLLKINSINVNRKQISALAYDNPEALRKMFIDCGLKLV